MKEEIILSNAVQGGRFRVKNLGPSLQQRRYFCALGLTLGTEIVLKKREFCGACSLLVHGCCLVLDGESASKIICEPVLCACV